MKSGRWCLAGIVLLLAACATNDQRATKDVEQAVRDYIEVAELTEVDGIRTHNDDQWIEVDPRFVVYLKRKQAYLFEFMTRCRELNEYPVVPDVRRGGNAIAAGFDTLRGCRITKIYELTEDQVVELRELGESPGSRN